MRSKNLIPALSEFILDYFIDNYFNLQVFNPISGSFFVAKNKDFNGESSEVPK